MLTKTFSQERVIQISIFALLVLLVALLPQLRVLQGNPLIFSEETYGLYNSVFSPTSFFEYIFSYVYSSSFVLVLLPILFAVLSLFFIFLLLKTDNSFNLKMIITGVVVSLTPAFLYAHLSLSLSSILLLVSLASVFFFLKKSFWQVPFLTLLFLLDFISGLILTILFFFYAQFVERKKVWCLFFPVTISTVLLFLFFPQSFFSSSFFSLSPDTMFSFFGALSGFTLFLLVLGGAGLVYYLLSSQRVHFFLLAFVLISFVYFPLRLLGIVILAGYSAVLFLKLLTYSFSNEFVGQLSLFLIVCVFLFSTVWFVNSVVDMEPSREYIQGMDSIFYNDSLSILVHEDLVEFVTYQTGMETFSGDDQADFSAFILYRSYSQFQELLESESIGYVVIDRFVLNEIQLHEGILFLMDNNRNFQRVFAGDTLFIYRYLPAFS